MAKQWQTSNEITITGGSDTNSEQLRSWLSNNATQVSITDLTGTKWIINETLSSGSFMLEHLNFTSNGETFSGIWNRLEVTLQSARTLSYLADDSSISAYSMSNGWSNEAYRTIEITGGTDATNSTLISWLEENGTLTAPGPQPTGNTYNLTHTLTNLTKGNITIQITPDTGYTYPTSLTITNGTLVSYDNTTGIAVVNGDDTTIVSGECVAQASGYSGNISAYIDPYVGGGAVTHIKFDTPPTSYDDNDSVTSEAGSIIGLTSYQNKTKIYIWGYLSGVIINGITYDGGDDYSQATEVLLTGNYNIELRYSSGGSN